MEYLIKKIEEKKSGELKKGSETVKTRRLIGVDTCLRDKSVSINLME